MSAPIQPPPLVNLQYYQDRITDLDLYAARVVQERNNLLALVHHLEQELTKCKANEPRETETGPDGPVRN